MYPQFVISCLSPPSDKIIRENFTFTGPCLVNVFKYNQQDATLHNTIYYYNALHASGGFSAHHQELKTVYTTSGICRAFSAFTAVVGELEQLTHDSGKK